MPTKRGSIYAHSSRRLISIALPWVLWRQGREAIHLATASHLSKPTTQQSTMSWTTTLLRPLPLPSTPTWLTYWHKHWHPSKPTWHKSTHPSSSSPLTMHSSIDNNNHWCNKWHCSQEMPPQHETMCMCPRLPRSMPRPLYKVFTSNPTILLEG